MSKFDFHFDGRRNLRIEIDCDRLLLNVIKVNFNSIYRLDKLLKRQLDASRKFKKIHEKFQIVFENVKIDRKLYNYILTTNWLLIQSKRIFVNFYNLLF